MYTSLRAKTTVKSRKFQESAIGSSHPSANARLTTRSMPTSERHFESVNQRRQRSANNRSMTSFIQSFIQSLNNSVILSVCQAVLNCNKISHSVSRSLILHGYSVSQSLCDSVFQSTTLTVCCQLKQSFQEAVGLPISHQLFHSVKPLVEQFAQSCRSISPPFSQQTVNHLISHPLKMSVTQSSH